MMMYSTTTLCTIFLAIIAEINKAHAFGNIRSPVKRKSSSLSATKKSVSGFGAGGFGASSKKRVPRSKSGGDLISALNDDDSNLKAKKASRTFVKADQEKCKLL